MTGIEALQIIKDNLNYYIAVVENTEYETETGVLNTAFSIVEKELKAFQLLFTKNILNTNNNGIISIWETKLINEITYSYEMQILLDNNRMIISLPKEEFDLLKKVFENEQKH